MQMTKYIEMIKDISCGGNFVIKFQSKEISAHGGSKAEEW